MEQDPVAGRPEAPDGTRRLGFGQFLGRPVVDAEEPGLSVREIAARPTHYGVPRHRHEEAHFFLVVSGTFETTARNLRGPCHDLTLLFHPADTTHEDQFLSPRGRCVTVSLKPEVVARFGCRGLPGHSVALDDTELGFPGARMRRELHASDPFSTISMESLVLEMIGRVLAHAEPVDAKRPRWLAQAVAFLREGATDPVRVSDVAEAVGVHPVHLARVFRHHLDLSPGDYLRRARVRAAMALIESTTEPLASVALQAGFYDQSKLTTAFRRELGITPAAYRRAIRY